jgi:hypothetical protein
MKTQNMEKFAVLMTFVLTVTTPPPLAAEGLNRYTGTAVKKRLAVTQTLETTFSTVNQWVPLPNASLTYFAPPETKILFDASFSAECTKSGGGSIRIRIVDNDEVLEPNHNQLFCQSPSAATHTGNWLRTVPAVNNRVTHAVKVEFLLTAGTAVIDDWPFALSVYAAP